MIHSKEEIRMVLGHRQVDFQSLVKGLKFLSIIEVNWHNHHPRHNDLKSVLNLPH